jgi:benzoyl-CoA reductase/2-hydroxyglutaryl-CoA dehydratase subunit BcrC/BadD/HgdB
MRNAYIQEQFESHGRGSVAVLPVHYPKELLTAHDLLAVELWGPPGNPRGNPTERVQTYICSIVRNALAFIGSGGADAVQALLFPHTCDSLQGLATLIPDFGGWERPVFRFQPPKGGDRPSARRFLRAELELLANNLATVSGAPLDLDRLRWAIKLHGEIDRIRTHLQERRAHLPWNDTRLYHLLRRGEYLWPEEHLNELCRAHAALAPGPVQEGIPLFITGYVPEPMPLFQVLESAGAYVVADDYAAIGRRINRAPRPTARDPLDVLVDLAFTAPPCPTRGTPQQARISHLLQRIRGSEASGVLIHTQKFCEPELFDVPAIRTALAAAQIPALHIEGEVEAELSAQTVTRLEAFVEMIAP